VGVTPTVEIPTAIDTATDALTPSLPAVTATPIALEVTAHHSVDQHWRAAHDTAVLSAIGYTANRLPLNTVRCRSVSSRQADRRLSTPGADRPDRRLAAAGDRPPITTRSTAPIQRLPTSSGPTRFRPRRSAQHDRDCRQQRGPSTATMPGRPATINPTVVGADDDRSHGPQRRRRQPFELPNDDRRRHRYQHRHRQHTQYDRFSPTSPAV